MSAAHADPAGNGRGSGAWASGWTHLKVDRRSPGYCRVTFDLPPQNTITATTIMELAELVELIEEDPDLNVIVFDSANPDVYLEGRTGMRAWLVLLLRLSRAPVVSIASIRGHARGAGTEFVCACDLRFGSREKKLVGEFHGVTGLVPIAEDQLEDEVEALALQVAALDHDAVTRSKRRVVERLTSAADRS